MAGQVMNFNYGNLGSFHPNLGDPPQQPYINGANPFSGHGPYCNGSCPPQNTFAHPSTVQGPAYQYMAPVDNQNPTTNTLSLPSGTSNVSGPHDTLTRTSSTQNSNSTQKKEPEQREQSVLCPSSDGLPEVDAEEDYDTEELDAKARLEQLCVGYQQLLRSKKHGNRKMADLKAKVADLETRLSNQEKHVFRTTPCSKANVYFRHICESFARAHLYSRTLYETVKKLEAYVEQRDSPST